jgi:hypothetical protein
MGDPWSAASPLSAGTPFPSTGTSGNLAHLGQRRPVDRFLNPAGAVDRSMGRRVRQHGEHPRGGRNDCQGGADVLLIRCRLVGRSGGGGHRGPPVGDDRPLSASHLGYERARRHPTPSRRKFRRRTHSGGVRGDKAYSSPTMRTTARSDVQAASADVTRCRQMFSDHYSVVTLLDRSRIEQLRKAIRCKQ